MSGWLTDRQGNRNRYTNEYTNEWLSEWLTNIACTKVSVWTTKCLKKYTGRNRQVKGQKYKQEGTIHTYW